MKKVVYICLLFLLLCRCGAPKNFSYRYTGMGTGLESRININGVYISEHGCDSAFYSLFMFYPDGLFTIATTSEISHELIDCFARGGKSTLCKYPVWGFYRLHGDTIRTQVVRQDGGGFVIFRDYLIVSGKEIVNISDYVEPAYTNLGYLENYPSFYNNTCGKPARFYPLNSKRDIVECPLLDKGWFGRR